MSKWTINSVRFECEYEADGGSENKYSDHSYDFTVDNLDLKPGKTAVINHAENAVVYSVPQRHSLCSVTSVGYK